MLIQDSELEYYKMLKRHWPHWEPDPPEFVIDRIELCDENGVAIQKAPIE